MTERVRPHVHCMSDPCTIEELMNAYQFILLYCAVQYLIDQLKEE